jgi:hypothetical protein
MLDRLHPQLWLRVPRAMTTTTLVVRKGLELDSEIVRNLPPNSTVFVIETMPSDADGSVRALIADTPLAARPPLGWVTSIKDGTHLLDYVKYESAVPTVDGATGFFTSVGRPQMAPLPDSARRSEHGSSPRFGLCSARMSDRGEAGSKLVDHEGQDAPKASGRKSSPSPRLRSGSMRDRVTKL